MQHLTTSSLATLFWLVACVAHSTEQGDGLHQLDEGDASTTSSTPDTGEVQFEAAYILNSLVVVDFTTPAPIYVERCNDEERGMDALESGQEAWLHRDAPEVNAGSFLDGHYYEDELGCDFVGCLQLKQFRHSLARVEHVGEVRADPDMPLPSNWNDGGVGVDGGALLSVFESRTVTGRVEIWFKYHHEGDCSDGRTEYRRELDTDKLEHRDTVQ